MRAGLSLAMCQEYYKQISYKQYVIKKKIICFVSVAD